MEKVMQAGVKKKKRLGELLVENGLINTNQLKDALKRQAQTGGQLGSILVDMEYITTDDLLNFLSRQFGIASANLLKMQIPPDLIKLMPIEKIKAMKVLPIGIDENSITLAMTNPRDMISLRDIEFSLRKKVIPVVVPSSQMDAAIQSLDLHPDSLLSGESIGREIHKTEVKKAPPLMDLLKDLTTTSSADILLTAGVPPCIKLGRYLTRTSMASLTPSDCERYARELTTEKDWEEFLREGDYYFAVTYPEIGRFRINLYRQRNSISVTLRPIADILQSFEELGLPEWIKEYVLMPQGLIIVSSPAGHGKTTSLAAMVDIINSSRRCNVVTLEDPIEYLHTHKKSNVNQREIGRDTKSFREGMKHVFRQDPDVIVLGEMMDADTSAVAMQAANTGHLVLAALHAKTAASAVKKVINMFPPEQRGYARTCIAENLLFVLSQRMATLNDGEGRVLAYEKLINRETIKELILGAKTDEIKAGKLMETDEYAPLESSLAKLHLSGFISFEEGLHFSENKQFYKDLTKLP